MIAIEHLTIRAGAFALEGVCLGVPAGGYGVLMGPTGSGKTTLLETICGLRHPSAGRILLGGRDATALRPGERGIGYVPQDGALFPTMNVREHLAFGLAVRHAARRDIDQRVGELSELLGLRVLLERRPRGLSGGEKQRVALGRALAIRPAVLLFDEPLSALDDDTRHDMYDLLRRVRGQSPVTVLHVTHSGAEARHLGDCHFRLEHGQVRPIALSDLDEPASTPEPYTPKVGQNPNGLA